MYKQKKVNSFMGVSSIMKKNRIAQFEVVNQLIYANEKKKTDSTVVGV